MVCVLRFAQSKLCSLSAGSYSMASDQSPDHQRPLSTRLMLGRDGLPAPQGLYDPRFEHDSCGVGFVCHVKGKANHKIVDQALEMLENMVHRGACGCETDSGDGAGIMLSMPDKFFRREAMKWGF